MLLSDHRIGDGVDLHAGDLERALAVGCRRRLDRIGDGALVDGEVEPRHELRVGDLGLPLGTQRRDGAEVGAGARQIGRLRLGGSAGRVGPLGGDGDAITRLRCDALLVLSLCLDALYCGSRFLGLAV